MNLNTANTVDIITGLQQINEIDPMKVVSSPEWKLPVMGRLYFSRDDDVIMNILDFCCAAANEFLRCAAEAHEIGAEEASRYYYDLNTWMGRLWSKWINVRWGRDYTDGSVLAAVPNAN